MNQIEDNCITENLDGFFRWQKDSLYYYNRNKRYLVRHVLFDEYQDFNKGALGTIIRMASIVPFTISYDYSQSIYKTINRTADSLEFENVKKYILRYSYRVNSMILLKLKRIMQLIMMLSNDDRISGGVSVEERDIINTTESALEGADVKLVPYKDKIDRDMMIEDEYNIMRNGYQSDDIVVTSFIPDFFCNLQKDVDFRIDEIKKIDNDR